MNYISDIPRTAMEVYQMLPEGTLCEVIDNTLFMSPSPTTYHQRLLGNFYIEMQLHAKRNMLGEVFISPCDVYLDDDRNVVQPDVIFISTAKADMVQRKGIYGPPDALIEILSTNISHDKKRKLELYERNGVPEYIIVDPDTRETWHYLLEDGKYLQQDKLNKTGEIYIHQLSLQIAF